MKPSELISMKNNEYFAGLSQNTKTFMRYKDKDSVVAYRKSFLGTAFLIKGKIELFGFVILNSHLRWGNRELMRKGLKTIQILFNVEGNEKIEVIDEEHFKIFERRVLLEGLKDDD